MGASDLRSRSSAATESEGLLSLAGVWARAARSEVRSEVAFASAVVVRTSDLPLLLLLHHSRSKTNDHSSQDGLVAI